MCSYYTVPVQWKTHNLGCHLLQKATVAKAVTEPRHAVKKAYASKIWKAGKECRRQGIMSTPLSLETLGGWHVVAAAELRKLG